MNEQGGEGMSYYCEYQLNNFDKRPHNDKDGRSRLNTIKPWMEEEFPPKKTENDQDGRNACLMDLIELCMSQSLMIFLLASLRNLSATGRIRTKYESLAIDSDMASKVCARDMAGYTEDEVPKNRKGLTPSMITAILLLEIIREMEAAEDEEAAGQPLLPMFEEHYKSLKVGADYYKDAVGLDSVIVDYKRMIENDKADDIPRIRKKDFPLDPPRNPAAMLRDTKMVSSFARLDIGLHDPHRREEDEDLLDLPFVVNMRQKAKAMRQKILHEKKTQDALQELGRVHSDMIEAAGSHLNGEGEDDDEHDEYHDKDGIYKIIEQAIETRDDSRLEFLKTFFQEGSVSRLLVERKDEWVWLHDWYPATECTYAISVNKELKRVMVVFRGCSTLKDWFQSTKWNPVSAINPILEKYPNRLDRIKIYKGFHEYLFRMRKDTGTTKYDEIACKLEQYCKEVGEGYHIIVTGHSLGGALTSVFAFYASTEERFTRYGPVQAVTFGQPRVAGYQFADAVRHQEDTGRLRIVRLHNARDVVPRCPPFLFRMSKRGAVFVHVGLGVSLPLIRKGPFKLCGQPQPKLHYCYQEHQSFFKSWWKQVKGFALFNFTVRPWKQAKTHTLEEHRRRLLLADDRSPLKNYSLEECYEMRSKFAKI